MRRLVLSAPTWTVVKDLEEFWRCFDGRRFSQRFLGERSSVLLNRRRFRRETNNGAWNRLWTSIRPRSDCLLFVMMRMLIVCVDYKRQYRGQKNN